MKQRLAPLALLFGLITALMLGSTSMALAHGNPHSGFNCNNVGVNLVTCSKVIAFVPVVVNITDNDIDVLSDIELVDLEHSLNNVTINILSISETLNNIKAVVPVSLGDLQLCIGSVCLS